MFRKLNSHLKRCKSKYFDIKRRFFADDSQSFSCTGSSKEGKALILGIFSKSDGDDFSKTTSIILTQTAKKFNQYSCNKLLEQLKVSGPSLKLGESRVFFNIDPSFPIVALVGLGNECYGYNKVEVRDEAKEAARIAVGAGCQAVQRLEVSKLYVESLGHTESVAEGAALALWVYQDLKSSSKKKKVPYLGLYDDCDWTGWQVGLEKASAQNLARQLMETPSNLMTPIGFAISSVEAVCRVGANVEVRVEAWAKENKMNSFLAVAKGSLEEPIFLELSYNGCDPCEPPVVLVGKGITFDSGGLCMKSAQNMALMRGDMAGAACVVATVRAAASLKLPVNIRALIPLCENLPGASATKPGDIVIAMNGKTILISNTDYEGQLILADALCYAQKFRPKFILDVGTVTKEIEYVMGSSSSGVFTNDEHLWTTIKAASIHTGDRLWRFPLWSVYDQQVTPPHLNVDLSNEPQGSSGFTCSAAAFLAQFICHNKWIHVDTGGVMFEKGDTTYLRKGMSGRPTRTLIEFIAQLACKPVEC